MWAKSLVMASNLARNLARSSSGVKFFSVMVEDTTGETIVEVRNFLCGGCLFSLFGVCECAREKFVSQMFGGTTSWLLRAHGITVPVMGVALPGVSSSNVFRCSCARHSTAKRWTLCGGRQDLE